MGWLRQHYPPYDANARILLPRARCSRANIRSILQQNTWVCCVHSRPMQVVPMRLPQFHAHSQLACDSAGAVEIRQLVASLEVAAVPSPQVGRTSV